MAPSSHSGELWGHHLMPSQLDVDCLLPNGIIIRLRCQRDSTLEQLRGKLWKEAKQFPLFSFLAEKLSSNIFVGITQDAENEEFYDETRRLCDLRLFQPILRVVEPEGNREEKMLNADISNTIGVSVNEFQEIKSQNLEVMTFQRNMLSICKDIVQERESLPNSRAKYVYSADIVTALELPQSIRQRLQNDRGDVMICVWAVSNNGGRQKYTVKVDHRLTPEAIIAEAIRKRTKTMNLSEEEQEKSVREFCDKYVLKVCGCEHFLLDEVPIYVYRYIRRCLMRDQLPQLMLMSRDSVYDNLAKSQFFMPSYVKMGSGALDMIRQQQTKSLWDVANLLTIKIQWATYVNVKDRGMISIKVGVFHGTEALCLPRDTKSVDASNPKWNEVLTFDLDLRDIPRSARICITLCSLPKKSRELQPLGWCNLNLFDFNRRLLAGKLRIKLWPVHHGHDELLYPIGIPGENYVAHDAPTLGVEFEQYRDPVAYPSDSEVLEFALNTWTNPVQQLGTDGLEGQFESIVKRDPLAEISEQEKELLWRFRYKCQTKYPECLPKLLTAVKWNSREDVSQLYLLLTKWPPVSVQTALELLYCTYPDINVRQFAVDSLKRNLTSDQLCLYMPQLVQVLKFEPYLDNELIRFLLTKALKNSRIGHLLFWHMKAEMYQPTIRLRFALVLEAYCRGCGFYIKHLHRQVDALDKLTKLSNLLKAEREECQLRTLQNQLKQPDYEEALKNINSPLDLSCILGKLKIENCQVMQSAKKPLKLSWTNPDPMAECYHTDFQIIFKNGDDLRQDMLTLQMFRLMEDIWQKEDLDIWMLPYGCLATGQDVGVIEVVRNSKTVMKIQNEKDALGALKMSGKQLHQWIKDCNSDPRAYDTAIDTFTKSCAGYCVATFILGIGDRHPDNIMVTKEGQVFHIDFGHFLDHRKKKFGICRERVPFVLTDDFMNVIVRGEDPRKSDKALQFMKRCSNAYKALRLHSREIITLFLLMVTAGITEMQSVDDLAYLRKTLAVDLTESAAEEYFMKKFSEAYEGAWNTKLDWLFHWANTKRKKGESHT